MTDRLGLVEYLVVCLDAVSTQERRQAQWVMNGEWLGECLSITDTRGRHLWTPQPGAELLFGLPVTVRDNGGAPHLEPARDRG